MRAEIATAGMEASFAEASQHGIKGHTKPACATPRTTVVAACYRSIASSESDQANSRPENSTLSPLREGISTEAERALPKPSNGMSSYMQRLDSNQPRRFAFPRPSPNVISGEEFMLLGSKAISRSVSEQAAFPGCRKRPPDAFSSKCCNQGP